MHNSLRSQTQLRLDQGFLGFDTQQRLFFDQSNRRIGVGALPGSKLYPVHSLTNSEEAGDFRLNVARQANMMIGSDPILLVVKKNASILRNLIKWATLIQQERHPESGRLVVPDVPILVIDDEADYASVNTRDIPYDENGQADPDFEPDRDQRTDPEAAPPVREERLRRIHGDSVREHLHLQGRVQRRARRGPLPEELHRQDSSARRTTLGPNEVFGIEEDPLLGLEGTKGLPIVRLVDRPRGLDSGPPQEGPHVSVHCRTRSGWPSGASSSPALPEPPAASWRCTTPCSST